MTAEEVQAKLLLPRRSPVVHEPTRYAKPVTGSFALPATFDWRDQGAVTDVRVRIYLVLFTFIRRQIGTLVA